MGPIGKKTSKIPLAKEPILSADEPNGIAFGELDSYNKSPKSKNNNNTNSTVASSTVESPTVIKDDDTQESLKSKNNDKVEEQISAGSLATSPNATVSDRGRTESNSRIVQESESDGNVKRSGSGNIGSRVKSISSSSTGQAPMYKKQSSIFDDKNTLSASDEQQRRYFSTSRTTSSSSDANNNIISKQ